jgi:concanavalin A-like lectin/glucanase superfamily protein
MKVRRLLRTAGSIAAVVLCGLAVAGADGSSFIWQETHAKRLPGGLLEWSPQPFRFEVGESVRYIDFENGDDSRDGASRETAWKHHPWDPVATNRAAAASGVHTYVFKRGVVYRGRLIADEDGQPGDPIRLTSDPTWGDGEATIHGSGDLHGGWRKLPAGQRPRNLPEPDKVWRQNIGPGRGHLDLWEARDGAITRIPLARTPNWSIENWDDTCSQWAQWKSVRGVKGEDRRFPKVQVGVDQSLAVAPDVFDEPDAHAYDGAVVWTEYAGLMGSPFAVPVEEYDPKQGAVRFGAPWSGNHKPAAGARFFVENHIRFLDAPGEFHYDDATGWLYLRLPDDRNPNDSVMELPRWGCLIDLSGRSHVQVTALTFRFQKTNQYYHRFWDIETEDPYVVRALNAGEGIRIAHNRFEHIVSAVVAVNDAEHKDTGHIVITDSVVEKADRDAFRIENLARAEILRNAIREVGSRPRRAAHGHTIQARWITELTVAGNIVERTFGSAIFLHGGKGNDKSDVPLTRYLVFQNQVSDTCLRSNDWGGIETWQGGPAYMFDNVSLNPGGYWKYLDVITNENWARQKSEWMRTYKSNRFPFMSQAMSVAGIYRRQRRNAYSARFAFPLYMDGAFKQYWFNNIAAGKSSDPESPLCGTGGLHAVAGGFLHSVFNNTFYRLGMGSARGGTYPAPDLYVANIFQDIGDLFFKHESPRAKPTKNAVHIPDADPSRGDKGSDSYTYMQAFGENLFCGTPYRFGVFERSGMMHPTIDDFRKALNRYHPLLATVGEHVDKPLLADPARGDFRPRPGSPAKSRAALVFVPWALYGVVGEWHFTHLPSEPQRIVGEHWFMTAEHVDRSMYRRLPRHDLTARGGVTGESYSFGVLEDWTASALTLDGEGQFLEFTHEDMTRDLTWEGQGGGPFPGKDRRTPDMDTNNFLIEVVLKIAPHETSGGLVRKHDEFAGYRLELDAQGRPVLAFQLDGRTAYEIVAAAALNDGLWHHLLADIDRGKGVTFYVDGKEAACETLHGSLPTADRSLSNRGDFIVGKTANGDHLHATLDFLRVARGCLADARTSIDELYSWEFSGPNRRTWHGARVSNRRP